MANQCWDDWGGQVSLRDTKSTWEGEVYFAFISCFIKAAIWRGGSMVVSDISHELFQRVKIKSEKDGFLCDEPQITVLIQRSWVKVQGP